MDLRSSQQIEWPSKVHSATERSGKAIPDIASLRNLSRDDQRARVGDSTRQIKNSKPAKLWRSHVRPLTEQRLADDEAEELVSELNIAMKEGDLEGIKFLTERVDGLANGICKMDVSKESAESYPRPSNSVVDFARRLRSVEE